MLPKIHLVTKRGSVLSLDASVTQQRLENNLNIKAENVLNLNTNWIEYELWFCYLKAEGYVNSTWASANWTAAGHWLPSSMSARSSWLVLRWECWEWVPSRVFWSLDSTVLKSDAEGIVGRLHNPPKYIEERFGKILTPDVTEAAVYYWSKRNTGNQQRNFKQYDKVIS